MLKFNESYTGNKSIDELTSLDLKQLSFDGYLSMDGKRVLFAKNSIPLNEGSHVTAFKGMIKGELTWKRNSFNKKYAWFVIEQHGAMELDIEEVKEFVLQ